MTGILDKIFCDKKVELGTVKRKLALPDLKMRIANNKYEIRDIRMSLESSEIMVPTNSPPPIVVIKNNLGFTNSVESV